MKKKICSFITRFGGTMAALALVVATMTANSTCAWLAYQPEEPEEAGFSRLAKKTPTPTSTTSRAAMPGMSHWGRLPLEEA